MSNDTSYVDEIKQKVLYERRNRGEIALMLDYGAANKFLNGDGAGAQWAVEISAINNTWKGNWKGLFEDYIEHCELQMLGLDGYSREQAIRMKGEIAKLERDKDSGGLLSIFKGNK